MLFQFIREQPQQSIHRSHGTGRQGAEGVVQGMHMFLEYVDIAGRTLAILDLLEEVLHKGQPLAAGSAPAAGFPGVEAGQVEGCGHHAGSLVKDNDAAGAQPRAGLGHRVEIHGHIPVILGEIGCGCAARDAGLEGAGGAHAAGRAVDDPAQSHAQRELEAFRMPHMTADAEQLAAGGLRRGGQPFPPGRAMIDDGRYVGQGLDIVDYGWLSPQAFDRRKGRFGAGIGPDSFQGVDQGCFFAADIASGRLVQINFQAESAGKDVFAEQSGLVSVADALPQVPGSLFVAAANKDEGAVDAQGVAGQRDSLNQQAGVVFQQHPIFVSAGLHLIAVADQVTRSRQVARHERPLFPRGETGAAPSPQTGIDNCLLDIIRRHILQGLAPG